MVLPSLIALFVIMPVVEIVVLFKVYERTGFLETVMIVIVTGTFGAVLAKLQGLKILQEIRLDMAEGRMPAPRVIDGFMIIIAGVLMITPGLITDGMGFLLLVPPIRYAIRQWMRRILEEKLRDGTIVMR